jgi:hypothetical protein
MTTRQPQSRTRNTNSKLPFGAACVGIALIFTTLYFTQGLSTSTSQTDEAGRAAPYLNEQQRVSAMLEKLNIDIAEAKGMSAPNARPSHTTLPNQQQATTTANTHPQPTPNK